MKFGTVVNCMDGRVQYPVLDYLKGNHEPEFYDAVSEAGPLKILSERTDACRLGSLMEQIRISLEVHGSEFITVVGHHDCAGNPMGREVQEKQMGEALAYLKESYGEGITYIGLYVNERWEVERVV